MKFLSTLSLRRATRRAALLLELYDNFYPRSPCGERPRRGQDRGAYFIISIHALLAESDPSRNGRPRRHRKFLSTLSLRRATPGLTVLRPIARHFYPRSPCGERPIDPMPYSHEMEFLSTLSLRRATLAQGVLRPQYYFYPRSPCGERPVKLFRQNYECFISIHALLAESDTVLGIQHRVGEYISIHALLAESDTMFFFISSTGSLFLSTLSLRRATIFINLGNIATTNFYPRSPCGERPITIITICIVSKFLSTLSLRRATPLR